jgi:hypothetical protein
VSGNLVAVGYEFTLGDVAFLRSAAGQEALRLAAGLPLSESSRLSDVDTLRRNVPHEHVAAVLETAMLRRRASSKVEGADDWLLTDAALQQASATPVAAHRAARLAGRDVHDVTCSIGADLAAFARVARRAVGSDLDPVRLAMAAHNLRDHTVVLARADALHPVSRETVVFADPSRRDSAGRRRWRLADFRPPLDELASVYSGRALVVKCAPGMDFGLTPWAAEVELVSLDGEVREAVLWSDPLATPGVRRRATVLSTKGPMWTITDADPDACPVRPVGQWLVNPDGAVVRAGLVRQYGARHGLGQLDARIAYLTGDQPPPGVRSFRVLEHGRYSEKVLRAALRRLGAGAAEILVRGLDVDPNALRPRLRLRGEASVTVVLTRVGRAPMAFICQAERH